MTEIIPAILPRDFAEIKEKIGLINGLAKTVQIDVCDGQFTPVASWPYRKRDDDFAVIGLEPFAVQQHDAMPKIKRLIQIVILRGRVEIGLALNMDTPVETIHDSRFKILEDDIQFIQLMGIDHIGFQGQSFDEKVIGRIKQVRLKYPTIPISIDGGVSLENASELIAAGADRLVVGSAIFGADNPTEALEQFKRIS